MPLVLGITATVAMNARLVKRTKDITSLFFALIVVFAAFAIVPWPSQRETP